MKRAVLFLLALALVAFGNQNWSFETLVLSIPDEDDFIYEDLKFGINEAATDTFDRDIDQAHPPCPPSGPCAYFPLSGGLVAMLEYDYRPIAGEGDTVTWKIRVTGTTSSGIFSWNTAAVPEQGEFWAGVSYPGVPTTEFIAMETNSSIALLPAQELTIKWVWNSEKVVEFVPEEIELLSNRPNPFNATTEIAFTLPNEQEIDLAIYDIIGNKVATLLKGSMSQGQHSAIWNGTDQRGNAVSAGLYFYSLTTEEGTVTRKMYLVK